MATVNDTSPTIMPPIFGRIQHLADGDNLDAFRRSGIFSISNPVDAPVSGNFFLVCLNTAIDKLRVTHQTLYRLSDGQGYVRTRGGNYDWTPWKNISAGGGGGGGASAAEDVEFTGGSVFQPSSTNVQEALIELVTRLIVVEDNLTDIIADIASQAALISGIIADLAALTARVAAVELFEARIDSLEPAVDALEAADVVLDGRLDTLETTVGTLGTTVSTLTGDVSTLETEVDDLTSDLATLSGDVSTLGTTVADHETRIDALEAGGGGGGPVAAADVSFDNTGTSYTATDVQAVLEEIESTQNGLASTVSTLSGLTATTASDLDDLEVRVAAAESDIDALQAADTSLDSRLDTVESDIDVLQTANTGTNTGDQNVFRTISVSGQSDVVADNTADTLTLAAGTNITITTNAGTDTITINGPATPTAGTVAYTPTGGISASTVQDAINELDSEKYDKTGGTITGNVTITGNLTLQGTTFQADATTFTVDDVIGTLGGDTAPLSDDAKDRGFAFRWHNGSTAKLGFFGFDRSSQRMVFVPDATNTSEVISGTVGTFEGNLLGNVTGNVTGALTGNVTGNVSGSANSISGTNTVTNANLVQMAQATIKGRAAGAGTGNQTDLTVAQVKTILGMAASEVTYTAGGTVSATNVQDAIAEVASEKVAKSGDTMTGALTTVGLVHTRNIQISGDMDTLVSSGFYDGAGLTNAPDGGWWHIQVQNHTNGTGYVLQTVYPLTESGFSSRYPYARLRNNGTWGPWREILTQDRIAAWVAASLPPGGGAPLRFVMDAQLTGANATGAQAMFGHGVTVTTGRRYKIFLQCVLSKTAGTKSHNINTGFGGTAVIDQLQGIKTMTSLNGASAVPGASVQYRAFDAVLRVATPAAITTAAWNFHYQFNGYVDITTGGTLIPQYSLSEAPGGAYTTLALGFCELTDVGPINANTNVGGWA